MHFEQPGRVGIERLADPVADDEEPFERLGRMQSITNEATSVEMRATLRTAAARARAAGAVTRSPRMSFTAWSNATLTSRMRRSASGCRRAVGMELERELPSRGPDLVQASRRDTPSTANASAVGHAGSQGAVASRIAARSTVGSGSSSATGVPFHAATAATSAPWRRAAPARTRPCDMLGVVGHDDGHP